MTAAPSQTITLSNPVAEHFETFIVGNSIQWQVRALLELETILPPEDYADLKALFDAHRPAFAFAENATFHDFVLPYAQRFVVQPNSATGQHVVICGAGPTLREHASEWCPKGDQVWGVNSALPWLVKQGHHPTHGLTVDQTPQMCAEWASAPDVEYLIASTVHPHLTNLLASRERTMTFFHNFVGIRKPPVAWVNAVGVTETMAYEEWLYALLYPSTVQAGSGLNSVTRAVDVAQFMGFERITVLGADCCIKFRGKPRHDLQVGSEQHRQWLRTKTVMHADGGHAMASDATPVTIGGEIDGRYWLTKPDMAISAQWLMKMARYSNGQVQLIGDTLPNALALKDDAFLERLPNFVDSEGRVANLPVGPDADLRN
jgi:uncharacterized Rossmann fold enzyme